MRIFHKVSEHTAPALHINTIYAKDQNDIFQNMGCVGINTLETFSALPPDAETLRLTMNESFDRRSAQRQLPKTAPCKLDVTWQKSDKQCTGRFTKDKNRCL
ncbi:hypothetical protein Pcar_2177 [Syntrophotalea carbinolica DSM 2380]|uniref:Uncharacterized protein n=1 Tax=Syntrophotalea carbinolica (strain DSM 2380 / NBRC 103641 / GraBd1) TaxID=338963 RepID=Q3A2J1_SYNC1|nr:hypothetical protein Pcar_2177 [Syntrophotalea carbinolica DSM 2380]